MCIRDRAITNHGDLIRKILAAVLFALSCQVALANEFQGRIVGVSDGDTITVLDAKNQQHKVRLAGIDAPEKSQAFGQASKKQLSELVFGKAVVVEWQKLDRYGRVVGKVLLDGFDVCLEQIRKGMAWHYKKSVSYTHLDVYKRQMASICIRSSACLITMRAISVLSAWMSTATLISACATYDVTAML